jgi:hypothetical protein
MVLILIVVVAYLVTTRIERSTSSVYANRLRAKIQADSGLAAAVHLLKDNTRYGNYITAMPPTSRTPVPRRTELYRPGISASNLSINPTDYLRLDNAVGEILSSRADYTTTPLPPADPRPSPDSIPVTGPFAVTDPRFNTNNSYDFNQIVRLGTSNSGRLVNPDGQSAFGQWVRVRNSAGDLIGRYAFFIEDESMKTNVNFAGNNIGASSSNLRINDLTLPATAPAPATQIQEIDPSAMLPTTANRPNADTTLTGLGSAGSRVSSRSTLGLLTEWATTFPDYAHIATVLSRDDDTTARGWQRLDLNKIVADAATIGTNAGKMDAATKIANWIRDAWTGSPLAGLADYQMFGEDWLRQQIAADIFDYIDADNIPTDMGDVTPTGYADPVPVIGIEKIPYLVALEVLYEASNSTCPTPPVAGTYTATLRLKLQFRFLNLFERQLDLADNVGKIEIKGVPVVKKNGVDPPVFDVESETFTINLADLKPATGTGSCSTLGTCTVSAGVNGTSDSGARTVQTDWLVTQGVTFTVAGNDAKPRLLAGKLTVKVYGKNGERLDDTAIVTNLIATGYNWSGSSSAKDFLTDATPAAGALQIASINLAYGYGGTAQAGDPRYRGCLVNDRWRNIDRSDATTPPTTNRIAQFIDKAELNPRAFGFDWFDDGGDRPLAFIRNGPMLNIGELGNIAATEYPWRTLYLQYPERPANTTQSGPKDDIPLRRSHSQDYVLVDLFRTQSTQPRAGAININTQQRFGTTQQHALAPLFLAELVGTQPSLTQTMVDRLCTASGSASYSPIFDRRIAVGPPSDNTPLRPFFQIGEFSSLLSRLVNSSTRVAGESRSTVTYSILRTNPATTTELNINYERDMQVEQEFREVSNSVTTRGNVFRVLYVGQAIKDVDKNGNVDLPQDLQAEYLGEAFVERQAAFAPEGTNPDAVKTGDSSYRTLATRVVTE